MSGIALGKRHHAAARKKPAIPDHAQEPRVKSAVPGMREKEALFRELSKKHRLKFFVLYTYCLAKQQASYKVRFVYCLKGRPGEKGIVELYQGRFLAPGCFIVPIAHDRNIQEIFAKWKVPCKRIPILID